MDDVARKQREREAEIEAKLAAKKDALRGAVGSGERSFSRGAPAEARAPASEERASERPRLNLKPRGGGEEGGRPSWREREATKPAGESSSAAAPPPASTSRPPPAERQQQAERPAEKARDDAPRRNVFVPPALRGREGGEAGGWRSRENSRQNAAPPLRSDSNRRDDSTRRDREPRIPRDESPLPPQAPAAGGKYRPGAFGKSSRA
jgi:translation initiation factor 3 subunit A